MSRLALGLDIGGSSVKSALLDVSEKAPVVVETGLDALAPSRSTSMTLDVLKSVVTRYRFDRTIDDIGVGLPGMVDHETGTPLLLPNFPNEWHGFPIRSALEDRVGQQVVLANDAKAFSVAEAVVGAARGHRLVACVVLGTGVGGGIVLHGKVWYGLGTAGELGHLIVDLDGPPCGCGGHGCVESFASAASIAAAGKQPTAEDVFAMAAKGDVTAQAAVDRAIRALGAGLANVFITLAPDVFVIGGGMATAENQLLEPLAAEIRRRVLVASPTDIHLVAASLGRHAGAIGAALIGAEEPFRPTL